MGHAHAAHAIALNTGNDPDHRRAVIITGRSGDRRIIVIALIIVIRRGIIIRGQVLVGIAEAIINGGHQNPRTAIIVPDAGDIDIILTCGCIAQVPLL